MYIFSYESSIGKDLEKEKVKPRFSATIMFVEDYLCNVVNQEGSFADKKQNKLTYQVYLLVYCKFSGSVQFLSKY